MGKSASTEFSSLTRIGSFLGNGDVIQEASRHKKTIRLLTERG
jgi:hypothetical protein